MTCKTKLLLLKVHAFVKLFGHIPYDQYRQVLDLTSKKNED